MSNRVDRSRSLGMRILIRAPKPRSPQTNTLDNLRVYPYLSIDGETRRGDEPSAVHQPWAQFSPERSFGPCPKFHQSCFHQGCGQVTTLVCVSCTIRDSDLSPPSRDQWRSQRWEMVRSPRGLSQLSTVWPSSALLHMDLDLAAWSVPRKSIGAPASISASSPTTTAPTPANSFAPSPTTCRATISCRSTPQVQPRRHLPTDNLA